MYRSALTMTMDMTPVYRPSSGQRESKGLRTVGIAVRLCLISPIPRSISSSSFCASRWCCCFTFFFGKYCALCCAICARVASHQAMAHRSSPYGQLVVLRAGQSGVAAGKIFPLGPSNIIGRSMENCEIALNDTFLSSQHARLELQGDVWVLEDLHSTNGTFVNEIEVRDATSLEEGDILRVGRVEMRLSR